MGKGDRKTRRGKIYRGSHGNVRPHQARGKSVAAPTGTRPTARKTTRRRTST